MAYQYMVAKGEINDEIIQVLKKHNIKYSTNMETFLKMVEEDTAGNRASNKSGNDKQLVSEPDGNKPFKSPNPSMNQTSSSLPQNESAFGSIELTEEEMENEKRLACKSTREMIEYCKWFSRRFIAEEMMRKREASAAAVAAAKKKLLDEQKDSEQEVDELRRAFDEVAVVERPPKPGCKKIA